MTRAFICLVLGAALQGCASYQMGEVSELPYRHLHVAVPRNLSTLPQIEAPLAAAIRQEALRLGSIQLAERAGAEAILEVTVVELKRRTVAVSSQDVGRGRKFELVLSLLVSLKAPGASGAVYLADRPLDIAQEVYADQGLVDAEYQAVPELSRLAAVKIGELLVDLW